MKSRYQLVMTITISKKKKEIHLGQTSPVGTMSKATNLEISQFFFSEQVVFAMVIVINSVIGGFSRVT